MTTSRSWDQGRDGRAVGPGPRVLVCVSITTAIEKKMVADLEKVAESNAKVDRVYFCTTQDASEATLDAVAAELHSLLGDVTIDPLDASQLAKLAGTGFSKVLEEHYPAELRAIREWLSGDTTPDDPVSEPLLLALTTAGHPQSTEIRRAAYQQIILRSLAANPARTLNEIGTEVQQRLRLAKPIGATTLRFHLEQLQRDGLVICNDQRFSCTDTGKALVIDEEEAAVGALAEGQSNVRLALEEAIGHELSNDHFATIWSVVERKLTHFFYTQGMQMVRAVARTTEPATQHGPESQQPSTIPFFVDELAEAVGATSSMAEQREELEVAVR